MPRQTSLWIYMHLLFAPFLFLAACNEAPTPHRLEEAWSRRDAPINMTRDYEAELARLAWEGRTPSLPWADSYWPSNKGGLSWRWQQPRQGGNLGRQLSLETLRQLSPQQLAALSPAEKFDILQGRYDYPLTQQERRRTSPNAPNWYGLCHGWAAASFQYREPDAVDMINPDGLRIPFASSDIKGLLAYAQQHQRPPEASKFLGLRCNRTLTTRRELMEDPACKGVNAGAFHIIMTNFIARAGRPFIMDISKGAEVWNMPAYGFRSKMLGRHDRVYAGAAQGTREIVDVSTNLQYVYIINPQHRALGERSVGQLKEVNYRYSLELDEAGRIIGGEWRSAQSPDFLWIQSPASFSAYFAKLGELYEAATRRF